MSSRCNRSPDWIQSCICCKLATFRCRFTKASPARRQCVTSGATNGASGCHQQGEQGVAAGVFKSPLSSLDSPYRMSSASTINDLYLSDACNRLYQCIVANPAKFGSVSSMCHEEGMILPICIVIPDHPGVSVFGCRPRLPQLVHRGLPDLSDRGSTSDLTRGDTPNFLEPGSLHTWYNFFTPV